MNRIDGVRLIRLGVPEGDEKVVLRQSRFGSQCQLEMDSSSRKFHYDLCQGRAAAGIHHVGNSLPRCTHPLPATTRNSLLKSHLALLEICTPQDRIEPSCRGIHMCFHGWYRKVACCP